MASACRPAGTSEHVTRTRARVAGPVESLWVGVDVGTAGGPVRLFCDDVVVSASL